mmetsp:Transcript_11181/g.45506  ORF Transcript_11181/g.45506 Transcript_11181/m.45506 type:complete len:300 (+) Transcript_11181:125-1024(+)
MGNDGGSVPRRIEIVKVRKERKEENKAELVRCKWETCALSKRKLTPPVVACAAGYLYNKDSLLQAMLEGSLPAKFAHVKSLKDLTPVRLTASDGAGVRESDRASYVCPVTQTPMKGTYQFSLIKDCGCVVSNRALDEIPDRTACMNCGRPLSQGEDSVLPLNGGKEVVAELLVKHKLAKKAEAEQRKARKKAKKRKRQEGDIPLDDNAAGAKRKGGGEGNGPAKKQKTKKQKTSSINSTLSASLAVKETAEQLMPKFANKDVYSSLFFKQDDDAREKDGPKRTTSNDAFCGRFLTHRPA